VGHHPRRIPSLDARAAVVLLLLVDEIQHDVIVGEIEIVFFLASIISFFSLFFADLGHIVIF
jgi:hypothetical protein